MKTQVMVDPTEEVTTRCVHAASDRRARAALTGPSIHERQSFLWSTRCESQKHCNASGRYSL